MITGHISFITEMEKDVGWSRTGTCPLPCAFFFYVLLIQARRAVGGLRPSAQIKAPAAGCSEHLQNHGWAESE